MADPMEELIGEVLEHRYAFRDERENDANLDFYLVDYDVYIEVKRFHSPRIAEQMERAENVIAVQGKQAVKFMAMLLRRSQDRREKHLI